MPMPFVPMPGPLAARIPTRHRKIERASACGIPLAVVLADRLFVCCSCRHYRVLAIPVNTAHELESTKTILGILALGWNKCIAIY